MSRLILITVCLVWVTTAVAAQEATRTVAPTEKESTQNAPKANETALQYIRASIEVGDYESAGNQLKRYQNNYGIDDEFLFEKTRFLADTHHDKEALALANLLLTKYPNNKSINEIKNIVLQHLNSVSVENVKASSQKSVNVKTEGAQSNNMQSNPSFDVFESKSRDNGFFAKFSEDTNSLVKQGEENIKSQDFITAAKAFEKAAELKINDASLYYRAAQAYSSGGDVSHSFAMINHALALDPKNVTYLKGRITINSLHIGNLDLFVKDNQEVLKQLPNDNMALLGVAKYYLRKSDYKSASQFYEKYLANNPDDNTVFINNIQSKLWGGNYSDAAKWLESYKTKFGTDRSYLTEQARLLAFTHHPKEALEITNSLLDKTPRNPDLLSIKEYAEQNNSEVVTNNASQLQPSAIDQKSQALSNQPKAQEKTTVQQPVSPLLVNARALSAKSQYKRAALDYQNYLKENPKDKEVSLEYIRVLLFDSEYSKATDGLQQYEKNFGVDDAYLTEKARLLALTNKSKEAISLTEELLKKHPKDKTLLEIKDYAIKHPTPPKTKVAQGKAAEQVQEKKPESCLLDYAHKLVKDNKLDQAVLVYCDFVKKYPKNKTAWIEYASVENWRSSYRSALFILDCYCKLFGPTEEYFKTKARVLANAERPRASLSILYPLLYKDPDNYELNYTAAVATYYNNQPIYTCHALNKLECMRNAENAKDIKSLRDFVNTAYRSNVVLDLYRSRDTDTVDIIRGIVSANIFVNPCKKYFVRAREERVSADKNSGLEPIDGGNGININILSVGVNKRINPMWEVGGAIGAAHLSDNHTTPIYNVVANYRPNDCLLVNLLSAYDYYDVSARALSLDVKQEINQLSFLWVPSLERFLGGRFYYANYTDSNSQWYASLAPKIGVIRSQYILLNFGLSGIWDGFSKQFTHGYYNPKFYQYYAVTADAYFNQSQNIGYGITLGLGEQKDETFKTFKFAGDFAVNGYFGIYQDWYLVLSAGGSSRGRAIGNNNPNNTYQVYAIEATLTRRF